MLGLSPIFSVVDLDSAALAGSAMIAHPLPEPGKWQLVIHRTEGQAIAVATIRVRKTTGAMAATIDLSAATAGEPGAHHAIRAGGCLGLRSTAPEGGRFALLQNVETGETDWDSRRLGRGDVFAFLPLRPGSYLLANRLARTECSVIVIYPDPRKNSGPPGPFEPVRVRSSRLARSRKLKVRPGQGFAVDIDEPARLTFTLEAADDGPAELARWRAAEIERLRRAPSRQG
jgi:hypothetical protein